MRTASLRGSQGPHKTADLFCTACDSQIGSYENEWIRLTSSYVIPRVIGTKFGIIVADEHRTVDGKEATALHGCELSEASCSKCSRAIGHFCRNAPGKSHLLGQYIYKLSKTHLRVSGTSTCVAFNLVFGEKQLQHSRSQSIFTAPRPAKSSPPHPHGTHSDGTSTSMGPPSSRPNGGLMIDPSLEASVLTTPINRESRSQSVELKREEKGNGREMALILQRLEEQDKKLSQMSDSLVDWKIQNGKLLAMLMRSSAQPWSQRDTPSALESMIDDFESVVNAACEARSNNDELESLRAENESMKAKLQTIASAMGSAIGSTTPRAQPLATPTTASSTPSALGKRKRMDARSRLSLVHNELSFTDEDHLHDESGLYAIRNDANTRSTPAKQPPSPSTVVPWGAQVSQHRPTPATTNTSIAKPLATPVGGVPPLAKASAGMLTPPGSGFTEQHDQERPSTRTSHSSDVEPQRFDSTAPEPNGNIHKGNAGFNSGHTTDAADVVERQQTGTTSIDGDGDDRQELLALIDQPEHASKTTPETAADTNELGFVAAVAVQRPKARASPPTDGIPGVQGRETKTPATNASRWMPRSALPGEAYSRYQSRQKEHRRNSTGTSQETVGIDHGDRDECNRLIRRQWMTRAAAPAMHQVHLNGKVNGHTGTSENLVDSNLWQDNSTMTFMDDEEREELFQPRQADQHPLQANGNYKENEQPYYAQSADGARSKQFSTRSREPNKPKRPRRKPDEIERRYKCLFPGCTKAYGELPHLNTHITDSNHGERWVKADYLEATKGHQNSFDDGMDPEGNPEVHALADEKDMVEAVAATKRNQEGFDQAEKLRQRDRMAKEAMEREEMMELMSGA